MRRAISPALTALMLGAAGGAAAQPLPPPTQCADCFRPKATTSPWQIQFQGRIDLSVRAGFFDIDSSSTGAPYAGFIRGRKVACYLNAGAWENYRPERDYPPEVLGKRYPDFPQERWVDIRRIDLLAPILTARMAACKSKGFDGVDPDNLNGFENDTGFPLSADDQLEFNAWLANEAHARGLASA